MAGAVTARALYRLGDRVRITRAGRKAERNAVVVGYCHQPSAVRILPVGCKTAVAYHLSFLEPLMVRGEGEDSAFDH